MRSSTLAMFVLVTATAVSSVAARAAPPGKAVAKAKAPAVEVTVKPGDEVDITSGAVTALSCALAARDQGQLGALNACPFEEATKGIVVFDVAERQIYLLDKKVRTFELEKAFGGGSIDFSGTVKKLDKAGVAFVVVGEATVTAKPKPGSFKGCL